MNVAEWIRDLPGHVLEALRSLGWGREGFSILRMFLSLMLLLSGLATGLGLLALVEANNAGKVGLVEGFLVVVLAIGAVVTMWIALEQAMTAMTTRARLACGAVYLFFALWSIGFGFGFYWNRLASMRVAEVQVQTTVEKVNRELKGARQLLGNVRQRIQGVEQAALDGTVRERDNGTGCGIKSGQGGGDICNARLDMTRAIHLRAADLVEWSGKGDLPQLDEGICAKPKGTPAPVVKLATTKLEGDLIGIEQQGSTIESGASSLDHELLAQQYKNYSTVAQGALTEVGGIVAHAPEKARDLRQLAAKIRIEGYSVGPKTCRDGTLADNIDDLAKDLENTPPVNVDLPELNLGNKATQAAFQRLYDNAFHLPGTLFGLGSAPADPLNNRDFIALIAAIAVDIAIFFLSILSHNASPFRRLSSVFALPIDAADLRRGLIGIVRDDPRFFASFRQSLAIYRGHYYLVASPDVPELYGSISNTIIMLHAAGLGQVRRTHDPAMREAVEAVVARLGLPLRQDFLDALRAPLISAARLFGRSGSEIGTSNLLALELPPRVVQAINLLLSVPPEAEGVAPGEAGPDARPGAGPEHDGGSAGPAGFGPAGGMNDEAGADEGFAPGDDRHAHPDADDGPEPASPPPGDGPHGAAGAHPGDDPDDVPPNATPTAGE